MCESVVKSLQIGFLGTGGDHPRHAHGLRAGPAPLPRPVGHELLLFLPDGDPRGRDGLVAAGPVRHASFAAGFWTILIAHIMFCLSSSW